MAEGLAEKGTTFNCRECKYGSECNTANAHGYKVGFCSQYTQKIKAQTNADRIRSMTDEELADLLGKTKAYCCIDRDPTSEFVEWFRKWLKEEVKDV